MDAGRRHETPGSKQKTFRLRAGNMSCIFVMHSLWPCHIAQRQEKQVTRMFYVQWVCVPPRNLTTLKAFTVWITRIPDHLICLLRNLCAGQEATVRTGHETTNWFQIGNIRQGLYCHPAYLTYTQGTSQEILGCMKHKLESRLLREKSITSDIQMSPPLWQKEKN